MTIKELVELACEKSPSFATKVQWYRQRKRPRETIDLEWLMPLLEEALGREFVEDAAQEEIEAMEAAQEEIDRLKSKIDENIKAHADVKILIPEDGEVSNGSSNEVQT